MSPAIQPLLASAATLAVAVGVWLLWRAWKRHPQPRGRLIAGGWALLLLAAVLLAPWAGGDRGVAIETLLAAVAATVFIVVSGRWASPKGKKARPIRATAMISGGADPAIGPATTPLRTVAAVLLALPVSLAASVGVGLVLAIWVPGSQADKLVTAAFGAPLVMAGAMVWTCADRRLLRTTAVLLAVTALCALAVVLRPH
ncbi:hypothetical protein ASD79_11695 [Caulobacter sp. Root655]|uniref:hypothetical protein n=1 Tax=Caulobacter sp. Root655 TaxID=1736578 RepID=UPI0006FF174B|nr:hypothetical protein [Caulobacter sp. Root655]KRA59345.1 hypothetical protein ASD79_11695 [Caulobacter sp. Root655]